MTADKAEAEFIFGPATPSRPAGGMQAIKECGVKGQMPDVAGPSICWHPPLPRRPAWLDFTVCGRLNRVFVFFSTTCD